MRIFVTGATGFVGSAVAQELLQSGHEVMGLARSEEGARSLSAKGIKVFRGDLNDLESLKRGASQSDAVIHTGFIHDFSKFKESCEIDRKAIETMGLVLSGSDKPLIITSAIGILPSGKLVTEETRPLSPNLNPRAATEEAADFVTAKGARVAIVRLSPSVHGQGDHGFIPILIRIAREQRASAYIDEGLNRWPAVHRLDAARVFRLALEKGFSKGARFHAVAEEGIAFKQIAEVIGKKLNVPVVRKSSDEAAAHFTWFTHFAAMNLCASSEQTKEKLGWHPEHSGLISDLEEATYF